MNITWLGTGSAFCMMDNYQTNALIEFDDGYRLLVDAGGDLRFSLRDAGLSYLDINGVYISHLHADHIGGLEYLAFTTFFDPRYEGKPDLFVSEFMVDDLWARSLSGGLASLQAQKANLSTYFNVQSVKKNGNFQIGDQVFNLVQMIHFVNGYTFELSFGLVTDVGTETVFFTTDTQHAPNQIKDFYNTASLIFQDCETAPFRSGVHAHFDELKELPGETRAKMWLVHYQDNVIADWDVWQEKAISAGFRGFVKKGQSFSVGEKTLCYE